MYGRTSRVLMAVALASFLLIVPNIEFIFSLISNPERFEDAKSVVVLVLLSRVIDYSFGSNGELLSNGPYFKWNLVAISGLVALLIGLNYALIPIYRLDGAGYALIISYAVFNIAKAVYLYLKENMQPFSSVQLTLVCIALPTYLLAMKLSGPSALDFIFTNAVVAIGLVVGFILVRKRI